MPELPEVETIRKGLEKKLVGKQISQIKRFDQMDNISNDLVKQTETKINKILRKGKYLIFELSNKNSIIVHLRMSGQLLFESKNMSEKSKFGTMNIVPTNEINNFFESKGLGVEPLSTSFTLDKFNEIMHKKAKSKIKNTLMDQKVIAGLGNIYAQEVCFYAGVLPERKIETLTKTELEKLYKGVGEILTKAIEFNGTSFDQAYVTSNGTPGEFSQFLKVYQQHNCKECNNKLSLIKMNSRGTYYCNKCQR